MYLARPSLLYLKAGLFVAAGSLAAALVVADAPDRLRTAALVAICVWSFSRAYYFAFYVVQHYADPSFRFAGLADFAKYLVRRRRKR